MDEKADPLPSCQRVEWVPAALSFFLVIALAVLANRLTGASKL